MEHAAVLIIGAGPVGLSAGLTLARAGIETIIVEKEKDVADDFRASTFHPPTLEMLDELDLAAPLIARGLISPTWQIRQHESHERALFDLSVLKDDTRYPFRLQCEQRILTALADELAHKTANLSLHYDAELVNVSEDDSGITATVMKAGRETQIRARYLIAADGARSVCRKLAGLEFAGETYPETTILATTEFRFEDHLPGLSNVNYVWCDHGTFSLLRLPDLWRCSLYSDPEESVEEALEPQSIERKLQRIVPRDVPYDVIEIRPYRIHRRILSDYRKGRIVFAGDSAHLTSPSGGMGMNGGIHDAINLSQKLIAIIRNGADDGLLDLYTRQRRPIAEEEILAQSHINRKRMQQRDPEWRKAELARLQAIIADPAAHREHLLKSSMLSGLARAAAIA